MGKTLSFYIQDDELVEWIEKMADGEDFHNQSHVATKAFTKLRRERAEDIQ